MIAILLAEMSSAVTSIAMASDDGDGGGMMWLLALGPAGAGAVYFALWRYYRNTHRSHGFEHETRVEAQPVTGTEAKVNEIKGTKTTGIDGENRTSHRQRVQRFN